MPTVNKSNNVSNNNKACILLLSFKDCTLVFKRLDAMSCSLKKVVATLESTPSVISSIVIC